MPAIVKPTREGPPLESDVMREVRMWLAAQPDIRIHRNNTGMAHVSIEDFVRAGLDPEAARAAHSCVRAKFHGMHFGLAIGSSDLIGSITVVAYERDAVVRWHDTMGAQAVRAHHIARFLAIELKQPGKKPTDDQERFLEDKRKAGAVAFWADSLPRVEEMISKARRWEI
jgi:hypothetical protein